MLGRAFGQKEKTGHELLNELAVDWEKEEPLPLDLVAGLVADEEVTLLGSHGGGGKSYLGLQIGTAAALGGLVLGVPARAVRVLYYSAEDGGKRLAHRMRKLLEDYTGDEGASVKENFKIVDASELDVLYGEDFVDKGWEKPYFVKVLGPKADYHRLQRMVEAFDPQLLIIDGASDTFDGNEIAKREVRAFIKMLRRIHPKRAIGVLLMVHIDRASARGSTSNDDGYSGSAAWHNSCRRRLYLQRKVEKDENGEPAEELTVLRVMKNQDAQPTDDIEVSRNERGFWERGPGVTISRNVARLPGEEDPADVIVRLIGEYYERGKYITTSLAPQNKRGAWAVLSGDPQFPSKLKLKGLEKILRQLERDGQLGSEPYKNEQRKMDERWHVIPGPVYTAPVPQVDA